MFSKANKTKVTAAPARAAPSLVSADLKIRGNLNNPGEVHFDGIIEGDITCRKLIVGEKASITGHVKADEVIIHGKVTGQVKAHSVQLAKTANVIGDIWYNTLVIEAGAFLESHCIGKAQPAADDRRRDQSVGLTPSEVSASVNRGRRKKRSHPRISDSP